MAEGSDRIRIDKWLWHARFCKTRALSASLVSDGKVRVNGQRIEKPGRLVGPGDVLTLGWAGRVVRVLACGARRGPATEAATLYEDLTPRETVVPSDDAGSEQAS